MGKERAVRRLLLGFQGGRGGGVGRDDGGGADGEKSPGLVADGSWGFGRKS